MKTYTKSVNTRVTPQSEPIPGKKMVKNSAGGYSFELDIWGKLDRFLIIGTEGGTYYIGERELTIKNAKNVLACIEENGTKVVERIVEISDQGLAPSNTPALFVLAMCAGLGDISTKKAALDVLPKVARIGTHLFEFVSAIEGFRGWGRSLKRAIANWYTSKEINNLAYQLVKYQQREGWSHVDLLRLAHPQTPQSDYNNLFRYICHGFDGFTKKATDDFFPPAKEDELPRIIKGFEKIKKVDRVDEAVGIIKDYKLPRECVPTEFLKAREVWETLLPDMPLTALIRNLGNLTKNDVIGKGKWENNEYVVKRLTNKEYLHKSRVHPIAVLLAIKVYSSGEGFRGSGRWDPEGTIVDALNEAFYESFHNVEPTNRRFVLGIDVSGSMGCRVLSSKGTYGPISCREAAAAMAMVNVRTEKFVAPMAFSDTFERVNISKNDRLDAVVRKIDHMNFGGTDCALPMIWALGNKIETDVFCVYTDSETWAGSVHPVQALRKYRETMGINAKLIVYGVASNGFTIADPTDKGMLDIVGFDSSAPEITRAFILE